MMYDTVLLKILELAINREEWRKTVVNQSMDWKNLKIELPNTNSIIVLQLLKFYNLQLLPVTWLYLVP